METAVTGGERLSPPKGIWRWIRMKCTHYKGDGYKYTLNTKNHVLLCAQCNMKLASLIMSQMATEAFASSQMWRDEMVEKHARGTDEKECED